MDLLLRRRMMMAPPAQEEPEITAVFDIVDISQPTVIIVVSGSWIDNAYSYIEVDGVKMVPTRTFQFSATGEHTVRYKVKDWAYNPLSSTFSYMTSRLVEVTLSDAVTNIPNSSFYQTGFNGPLWVINFPETLTEIGDGAFRYDNKLKNLILPASITRIGGYAFNYTFFEYVHVKAPTPPSLGAGVFDTGYKIYVGDGSSQAGDDAILAAYLADSAWSAYSSILDTWYNHITFIPTT